MEGVLEDAALEDADIGSIRASGNETEAGPDSLLLCIRAAVERIEERRRQIDDDDVLEMEVDGRRSEITCTDMRETISRKVGLDDLERDRAEYDARSLALRSANDWIRDLNERARVLHERLHGVGVSHSREDYAKALREIKRLRGQYREMKRRRDAARRRAMDYAYMKGVGSLRKYRDAILHMECPCDGDGALLSILESAHRFRVIVLCKDAFEAGDVDNVVQCSPKTSGAACEEPTHYVLLERDALGYRTLASRGETALEFDELPEALVAEVVRRVREGFGGAFGSIPEFGRYRNRVVQNEIKSEYGGSGRTAPDPYWSALSRAAAHPVAAWHSALERSFDGDVHLIVHSRAPQRGVSAGTWLNESMPIAKMLDYYELDEPTAENTWRRVLSNEWVAPFRMRTQPRYRSYVTGVTLGGRKERAYEVEGADDEGATADDREREYASVTHRALSVLYPSLVVKRDGVAYSIFEWSSGEPTSRTIEAAAERLREGECGAPRFEAWTEAAEVDAIRSKFSDRRNRALLRTLRATGDATLHRYVRGGTIRPFHALACVRSELRVRAS